MSLVTSIEWTDASWPVVRGCTKVSSGCDNCWAIQDAHLHAGSPNAKAAAHFQGLTQIVNGRPNWTGEVRLDESILDWPLRWRKPRRVFVASSGDLFHERLAFEQIASVWAMMGEADQHTYQILTKRPDRMFAFHSWVDLQPQHPNWRNEGYVARMPSCATTRNWIRQIMRFRHNIWVGVSVENQQTADERIPWLLKTPAAVRWVSYEPALGPVDFYRYLRLCKGWDHTHTVERGCWNKINWIVIGGESGRGARPFDISWARNTILQCRAAGVPVFVKQLGANVVAEEPGGQFPNVKAIWTDLRSEGPVLWDRKGGDIAEWPEDLKVREFPRGFETPPGADPVQESGTK